MTDRADIRIDNIRLDKIKMFDFHKTPKSRGHSGSQEAESKERTLKANDEQTTRKKQNSAAGHHEANENDHYDL